LICEGLARVALLFVLIVAPKLFIEPGTKAPFFKLLSVSGPGLRITSLRARRQVTNTRPFDRDQWFETFEPGDRAWVGNEHSDDDESARGVDYVFL